MVHTYKLIFWMIKGVKGDKVLKYKVDFIELLKILINIINLI